MVLRKGVVWIILTVSAVLVAADDSATAKWRLSKVVKPELYELTLDTHVEKLYDPTPVTTFEGKVVITINAESAVPEIVLHKSPEMEIKSVTWKKTESEEPLDFGTYDKETMKLTLKRTDGSIIDAGKSYLTIDYVGVHGDDMHGFYRSSYINSQNRIRWLATTQFESYDARRAFPCFDEPEFKAKYIISITIDGSLQKDNYQVLSNMPLEDGYPKAHDSDNTRQVYKFKESDLRLSSYLVAFIVSDFIPTDVALFEGGTKEFRTWAQQGPINGQQGTTSQLAGPAALDALQKLTGVAYGYPKVDQVGIPDFNAGAMENWGLVTYRERAILYDEKIHPVSQLQRVVTVTAHELAHQWFGNLVTLHWWSDLWLNEGFARFFEYHVADKIKVPGLDTSSWKLLNQMAVNEIQAGAFATDAQPNSRALTKDVNEPGEIDASFDDVAYAKGGSVIRMWMHTLGEEKFYAALNEYLNANKEGVSTPEILLTSFEAVVPDTLKDVLLPTEDFALWHNQAGYPVLHVKRNGKTSVLTQERYLVSGEDKTKPKWTVPITLTTSSKPDFKTTAPLAANLFKFNKDKITVSHGDDAWVLFNIQQTGFYRVNYDAAGWKALTKQLNDDLSKIHEVNRAQLLDDAMWIARSTNNYNTGYDVALSITKFLANEKELIPWMSAINNFNFLYGKVGSNPKIKTLFLKRIDAIYNDLTLVPGSKDAHTRRLLRPLVASLACKLGQQNCVKKASELFAAFIADSSKNSIHPDVMSTVLCSGLRENSADWDKVWDLYQSATDNSQQTMYLSALGCTTNQSIALQYLEKTINTNEIRRQDRAAVFSSVYNGNLQNIPVALKFLKDNLNAVALSYSGMDPLGALLSGIAGVLGSAEDVKTITDLRDYIKESTILQVKNGLTGANKAVDIVTGNKAWLDQKQDSIKEWLDSDANDTGAASATTITILALLLPTLLALKSFY